LAQLKYAIREEKLLGIWREWSRDATADFEEAREFAMAL
jgi:hypothetical protein